MKTSAKGKIALAVSEGIVDTAYKDSVGVWTIGIGLTKSAGIVDPISYIGKKVSIEQVFAWFDKTIVKYEDIVNRNVKVTLKQNEYDALVHFVYNIGETNFRKSKLLKNLNAGNKKEAFENGFHGWLIPEELKSRRDKERAIAQSGSYGGTKAPLYTANSSGKLKSTGKTVDVGSVYTSTETSSVTKDINSTNPQTPISVPQPDTISFWSIVIKLIAGLFGKK